MKHARLALAIAALCYGLSWFLPVVADQESAVPGWEAFRLALSPIWPYHGAGGATGFWDLLGVFSALSNLGFVVALLGIWSDPTRVRPVVRAALVSAGAVNTLWLWYVGVGELRLGYFLWLAAFFFLAAAGATVSGLQPASLQRPTSVASS
jgi:hypothetical protein